MNRLKRFPQNDGLHPQTRKMAKSDSRMWMHAHEDLHYICEDCIITNPTMSTAR